MAQLHTKCRYPNEYIYKRIEDGKMIRVVRTEVPTDLVDWEAPFDTYDTITFSAPHLKTASWADPDIDDENFHPQWNQLDGNINRMSHEGLYLVRNKLPLNIRGRTGLSGRGILGRYGPNHAADPIVTRWKRTENGHVLKHQESERPILQFVSIQRRDTGEWAIPGGMVDPGETVSTTVKREFMEEAMDTTGDRSSNVEEIDKMVSSFFANGQKIYSGYVDDPRNTDNAWMETVAFLFHDDSGSTIGKFDLKAGDDAKALKWTDISQEVELYASHSLFVERAVQLLDAHW